MKLVVTVVFAMVIFLESSIAQDGPLQLTAIPSGGNQGFGSAVTSIEDVNANGSRDVIISSPSAFVDSILAGRVFARDGATSANIYEMVSPLPEKDGNFGVSVDAVPDFTGDRIDDIIVGASGETDQDVVGAERAHLFDGATGALVRTLAHPIPEETNFFGFSVSGFSDLNGNGAGDVGVGAIRGRTEEALARNGSYRVYDGATGELIYQLLQPTTVAGGFYGGASAEVPDVNGDGISEIVVGAFRSSAGRAHVFDGATGDFLYTLTPEFPASAGFFGGSVSGVPDTDGDGAGDVLVGAQSEIAGGGLRTLGECIYSLARRGLFSRYTSRIHHRTRHSSGIPSPASPM